MTATVQELIPSEDTDRLEELERKVGKGLVELALAVAEIHEKELYRSAGYDSFASYCGDRLQYQKSMAYQILAAGRVFPLLDSATADSIRCERVFRPITKMRPENQAKVLTLAVKVSTQAGLRLTEKIVEDVAEKNFGWIPESKRKTERKQQNPDEASAEKRAQLTLALEVLATLGLGGFDAVQEFGDFYEWPHGQQAWQFLQDAKEASDG